MAVDNSAAESARSLLNGIDYSALIGGPLQAAITAQAMAAKSTWEFIQEVGLNTDKDGNKSAINVSFMYQSNGEMVRLIVPILVIVPIPLIVVDEIEINFTASINASSSSTSENASSTDVGGNLTASGSIGWGPFSLSASMSASYSSKQSSKATQDSRYSVEYTQNVRVHARQADMPAGLATVLNILSSAATGGTATGALTVSPTQLPVDRDPAVLQPLQINLKDSHGLNVAGTEVSITLPDGLQDSFVLADSLTGQALPVTAGVATTTTATGGNAAVTLRAVKGKPVPATAFPILNVSATINGAKQNSQLPITMIGAITGPTLTLDPSGPVQFVATGEQTIKVTATGDGSATASVAITGDATDFTFVPASPFNLTDGTASVKITPTAAKAGKGTIKFTATLTGGATVGPTPLDYDQIAKKDLLLVSRHGQQAVTGLVVDLDSSRRTCAVRLQDGDYGEVYLGFDPSQVSVRHDGDIRRPGDAIPLDERKMAQLEIEPAPDATSSTSDVTFQAGPHRMVVEARIS